MLDGRPTFAVGYERSFSSTERGRRFSRQQRGTRSGRNGLSVFVMLARRRRLQAQTGLASGRSSKSRTSGNGFDAIGHRIVPDHAAAIA